MYLSRLYAHLESSGLSASAPNVSIIGTDAMTHCIPPYEKGGALCVIPAVLFRRLWRLHGQAPLLRDGMKNN